MTYTPMAGLEPVTVQGCEVGCPHEWADASRPPRHTDDGVTNSGLEGGKATQAQAQRSVIEQAYCLRCGGWRGTLGLERTPTEYVAHLVAVFRELWRVLRDDGQCFVNIGDTRTADRQWQGIPQMLCFALQADGWRWEDEVIWSKSNPMPSSQTNRFTRSHEMLYLFNKSRRAFFDADAVREKLAGPLHAPGNKVGHDEGGHLRNDFGTERMTATWGNPAGRNRRSVWEIPTESFSGAHFATFPTALVRPCVLAGSSARGVCPQCSAPWERVIETPQWYKELDGHTMPSGDLISGVNAGFGAKRDSVSKPIRTLGWRPGCTCYGVQLLPDAPTKKRGMTDEEYASALDWWDEQAAELMPIYVQLPTVPATVLDPFVGSGTVGEVCRTLPNPRRFVGLDLSRPYLRDLALARSEYLTPAAALAELPLFVPEPVQEELML